MEREINVDEDLWVKFLLKEGADMKIKPHPENSIESPLMPVIQEEKVLNAWNFTMYKA